VGDEIEVLILLRDIALHHLDPFLGRDTDELPIVTELVVQLRPELFPLAVLALADDAGLDPVLGAIPVPPCDADATVLPGGGAAPVPGAGAAPVPGAGAAPVPGGGAAPVPGGGAAPVPGGGAAPVPGGGAAPVPGGQRRADHARPFTAMLDEICEGRL